MVGRGIVFIEGTAPATTLQHAPHSTVGIQELRDAELRTCALTLGPQGGLDGRSACVRVYHSQLYAVSQGLTCHSQLRAA